jgi:4-alpha-glucanotransferase
MRVPHYADWCEEGHMYQPMNYPRDSVGYTATHDTDTTVGYYESMDPAHRDCLHYNLGVDGTDIAWSMIDAVWGSNAVLALTTPQDLLGLGSEARLNTPGTAEGNWNWRVREGALDDVTERLARITDRHVR